MQVIDFEKFNLRLLDCLFDATLKMANARLLNYNRWTRIRTIIFRRPLPFPHTINFIINVSYKQQQFNLRYAYLLILYDWWTAIMRLLTCNR